MLVEAPIVQELLAERQVETRQRDILTFLAARFGPMPVTLEEKARRIQDSERLEAVVIEAGHCSSLTTFGAS